MGNTMCSKILKRVVREQEMNAIDPLPFIPDEIMVNILSRLPVKFVIRCRLVCKRWRDLTLDHDFVHLNFTHSFPLLVVADLLHDDPSDLDLLDNWWEPPRLIHRLPFYYDFPRWDLDSFISLGGLMVSSREFKGSRVVSCIFNPIYPHQSVNITLSPRLCVSDRSQIYGVFFHPSLKQYCSLWKIHLSDQPTPRIHYVMLTLGSNPSLKTVMATNLLLDRDKKLDTVFLLISNYLYWMLRCQPNRGSDVMKFDITTEEFSVIHCPLPFNTECVCKLTHLLNIDGILSYLLILPAKITIWRLKDDKQQLWWTPNEYILNKEICTDGFYHPLAVVNGKFAFLSDSKLYVCNLIEGTVKICQRKKKSWTFTWLSHQMSLASLTNCKSLISIDLDQDNKVALVEPWRNKSIVE